MAASSRDFARRVDALPSDIETTLPDPEPVEQFLERDLEGVGAGPADAGTNKDEFHK
jgi:hypothetical protein